MKICGEIHRTHIPQPEATITATLGHQWVFPFSYLHLPTNSFPLLQATPRITSGKAKGDAPQC